MPRIERKPLVWSNAACLAPVLALAAVLGATAFFNARIGLGHVTVGSQAAFGAGQARATLEGAAAQLLVRLSWAVTGIALLLVAVAALGGGLLHLRRWVLALEPRRRRLFLGSALGLLVLVGAGRFLGLGGDWLVAEPQVFTDLREATFREKTRVYPLDFKARPVTEAPGERQAAEETKPPPREDLEAAVRAENGLVLLAYLSFASLLAAASAALAVPSADLPEETLRDLVAERGRGLRALLYLGSGVLVLHALEMHAFYRWPGAWLPPEQAELVDRMAQGVSTANGAFFSFLLLALYLPTAGILRLRGLELAGEGAAEEETSAPPGTERRRRAREEGLVFSPFQELSHLLVALAPLLAGGPLAAALDLLRL